MRQFSSTIPLSLGLWLTMTMPVLAGDLITAQFPDDLSQVKVELCFDGQAPARLYRNSHSSADILYNNRAISIREYDGTVRLPPLPANSCLNWEVQFDAMTASDNHRALRRVGDGLIMNADIWFWQGPRNRDLKVRMRLPQGVSFSTPWKALGPDGDALIFQPDNTPPSWEAKLAVGRFNIVNIDIQGSQLRLAMPGGLNAQQQQTMAAWVKESATSVSDLSGSFPQPNPQVLIVPADERGRADMFGQVLRGGGVATTFYVNQNRSLQEFRDGWTATHEFSHMLLPYISSRDRWLSEGLASYYQNVLRARDGRLSALEAWQSMYDGFERGRKATSTGTLAQATRQGRAATMRVYWSGAALMLMADIQLRKSSAGVQSLDSALTSLAECCLDNGETWRARDMFEQLDLLTNTQVFRSLYQKYANAKGFPDMSDTWAELGIEVRNHRLALQQQAAQLDIRNAIMKE